MADDARPDDSARPRRESRRGLLRARVTRRVALSAAAGAALGVGVDRALSGGSPGSAPERSGAESIPFYGDHQAGIGTPPQEHLYFAAFDVTAGSAAELAGLLQRWTEAAAVLTTGRSDAPQQSAGSAGDPGEADGLPPARLTLTFGFGPGLFEPQRDLLLARRRPASLTPLPAFPGDQLDRNRSGGDLCVQACADDPQVAFHAIHVLSLLAAPTAVLRWSQDGFRRSVSSAGPTGIYRNLIGFKDGTENLQPGDVTALERFVWVQPGDRPSWMNGGTYLVVRRIEIEFSSWDKLTLPAQEQAIGRHKLSGDLLGSVPLHAHVRQAGPANNRGQRMLRRGYNYASPVGGEAVSEGQLQGGLLFIAFVRDPRKQFIPLQRRLATHDALSAFTLHTGTGVFACPPGTRPGGFLGETLFS